MVVAAELKVVVVRAVVVMCQLGAYGVKERCVALSSCSCGGAGGADGAGCTLFHGVFTSESRCLWSRLSTSQAARRPDPPYLICSPPLRFPGCTLPFPLGARCIWGPAVFLVVLPKPDPWKIQSTSSRREPARTRPSRYRPLLCNTWGDTRRLAVPFVVSSRQVSLGLKLTMRVSSKVAVWAKKQLITGGMWTDKKAPQRFLNGRWLHVCRQRLRENRARLSLCRPPLTSFFATSFRSFFLRSVP